MKKGKSDVFIEIIFVCENTKLKLPFMQIIFYVKFLLIHFSLG
jgi:hypothetical protein